MTKVLEFQLQHQSFQWIFKTHFLEDWLVWSPCSPRDSQESSPTPQFKGINSLELSLHGPTLTSIHDYVKNHSFDYIDLCQQSNLSVFNMLSRLVTAFLPRSKCLLITWLQSPSTAMLELKKIKSLTACIFSPSIYHEVMGPIHNLCFLMLSFKPVFPLSSFTFIKSLVSFSSLSAIRAVSSAYLRLLIFFLAIWFQLVLHPAHISHDVFYI